MKKYSFEIFVVIFTSVLAGLSFIGNTYDYDLRENTLLNKAEEVENPREPWRATRQHCDEIAGVVNDAHTQGYLSRKDADYLIWRCERRLRGVN